MKKLMNKFFNKISIKKEDSKVTKLLKIYTMLGLFATISVMHTAFVIAFTSFLTSCGFSSAAVLIISILVCVGILGYIINEFCL